MQFKTVIDRKLSVLIIQRKFSPRSTLVRTSKKDNNDSSLRHPRYNILFVGLVVSSGVHGVAALLHLMYILFYRVMLR